MSEPGIGVSGGGSVAVDTPAMVAASARLEDLRAALGGIRGRLGACLADPGWSHPSAAGARSALEDADATLGALLADADSAAAGLRIAAERYGLLEAGVTAAQRAAWATGASAAGTGTTLGLLTGGPVALLLPAVLAVSGAAAAAGGTLLRELLTTGRIDPQVDPLALGALRLALSSSDDLLRGMLFAERPGDLLLDDPDGPFGTAATAGRAAALLPGSTAPLRVRTTELPGAVDGPGSLAGLGARVPEADPGGAQVRIDRFPMPDGRFRWIVAMTGTVTFSPQSGTEPCDLRSDLVGVAGPPSDSERALVAAMRAAGVGAEDPVLLIGHSQGALDVVRLAQRRRFAVEGVVTLGGPTGQLVLPEDVPELAVEHDEDLVPALGGLAAVGAAGLHRVVVHRSVYAGGPPASVLPFGAGVEPHALTRYQQTLAAADASGNGRVRAFTDRIRAFLAAHDGRILLARVDREVRSRRSRR